MRSCQGAGNLNDGEPGHDQAGDGDQGDELVVPGGHQKFVELGEDIARPVHGCLWDIAGLNGAWIEFGHLGDSQL